MDFLKRTRPIMGESGFAILREKGLPLPGCAAWAEGHFSPWSVAV